MLVGLLSTIKGFIKYSSSSLVFSNCNSLKMSLKTSGTCLFAIASRFDFHFVELRALPNANGGSKKSGNSQLEGGL